MRYNQTIDRGVAQLVARTAGGREVAGSSPVTPTMKKSRISRLFFISYKSVEHDEFSSFFSIISGENPNEMN